MYIKFFKPLFDRIGALFFLLLLAPLILITAFVIAATLGFPIVFSQKRPGLHGKIFTIYKFRTMNNKCDHNGKLLSDTERLTSVGKWIRGLSLDELPQLWNVLTGEMSFIGPRPLLIEYLPRYTPYQSKRHNVKPGITGWAQVNGRNAISWEEKFRYDVDYTENISFWMDFKIFFLTFKKVLIREGITQEGEATMEEFKGVKS